ncbi:MAG: SDR family NAD(P)-dependent oxidoreductase [Acidobacteriota bacterium]
MKPVCFVLGAGAGIGGTAGRRFAREGYHSVLCRRSDAEGLEALVAGIRDEGGDASGFLLNAAEENAIEETIEKVEEEIGSIEVLIYNLGAQIGNRALTDTSYKVFELGWRMATFGVFRTASALLPRMAERGSGSFIVTSSTAAVRGNAGQHSHAAAMGGRRMLCQTLNAEFGPQGVHVAHVLIDGAVDAPDTLGKMLGAEQFEQLRSTTGAADGLIQPEHIAEAYVQLARQHRSTRTFEMDLRSFSDTAWWN